VLETLLRLLPVFIGIGSGMLFRRLGVAQARDGDFLFRVVFYICLPALMFLALATVRLGGPLALYPIAALIAVTAGHLAGRWIGRWGHWPRQQYAVLLTGAMIVNTGFALPFITSLYGAEGVVRIAAFDAVNTTLVFSWAYYTAARGNPAHRGGPLLLDRLLKSPPLYAIAAGAAVNALSINVPDAVTRALTPFATATATVISIAVGIMLALPREDFWKAATVVAARLGSGLVVGVLLVVLLGLDGMDRTILLLLAVAPVGFVTVTFASLERLDVRLAANALSLSMVGSFVLSFLVTLASA
jgi:malate permease and related proteins